MNVRVQYFKYRANGDHATHWRHEMTWLGEDKHGVWLGAEPGAILQRGFEEERSLPYPFVQLIAPDSWWTLIHNDPENRDITHYVDIVTRPVWESPQLVTMIDLDLDVVQRPDGSVYVDDEDEFKEHKTLHAYPPQIVDKARVTTAEVVLAIEGAHEPFASVAAQWLETLGQGH